MLTYYAIEVATAEVDGLTSFFGVNNFYLYQLQGTERFVFIPWDHDFGFTNVNHAVYFGAQRNRLIERLLANRELRDFYRETLRSIIARFMNDGWMTPQIDRRLALIREAVAQDRKRRGGDDPVLGAQNFDEAVAQIRRVVAGRAAAVELELDLNYRRRRAVAP